MCYSVTASLDEFASAAEYKETIVRLQRQLAKAKEKQQDLVDASFAGAHDAVVALGGLPSATPAPKKAKTGKGKAEVALLHATDFQGSKLTPTYDSTIMRNRALEFVNKSIRIADIQRMDHPVNEAVIMFGGDMVEGLFNFPTQAFEIDATLFDQWVQVSAVLVEVVQLALANFDKVTVVPEWGNHGRIGSKRDCVPRSDNIDRMCYEFAKRMLINETRLVWQDCPEDIQRVEIGNYRALLIHGDEVGRNGFASLNTIVQHANKWQAGGYRVNGKPWVFRDLYVGHYHTHYETALPNGTGAVYGTGSTESDNRYAAVHLASQALPSQRLHFIDPEEGFVTATYKIHLT